MTETLLEFPTEVTVKAMGLSDEGFVDLVTKMVTAHLKKPDDARVKFNSSSKGKYISVSVTFIATSQAQLEAIYGDLYDSKDVVFTL